VKAQPKTNLESLWDETARRFGHGHNATPARRAMAPLEIHDQLVKGLPGEALFVSSAMAFDSMTEALALFDVSAKTAKQRIGERLSSSESEIALRIGRVWAMAADVFASLDAARNYLRTPNFGSPTFDALDSAGSIAGPKGWRYNDLSTEILYTAEVEALATLEVALRPGLETIRHILIATIEIPNDSIASLDNLGIKLPNNWNARPVADDSRLIATEFFAAIAKIPTGPKPVGLRVPSVLSSSDYNILLDPSRRNEYKSNISSRLPFKTLRITNS